MKAENCNVLIEEKQGFHKCEQCGEEFIKPIFATVSSRDLTDQYYACPRCLSKVRAFENQKNEETCKEQVLKKKVYNKAEILKKGLTCNYSLGHLKKRPKNTPIPEECFTCTKMIECLAS